MDVLKILTRSTNVRRRSNNATSVQRGPILKESQEIGQVLPGTNEDNLGLSSIRGTKRKRKDIPVAGEDSIPPNFFERRKSPEHTEETQANSSQQLNLDISAAAGDARSKKKSQEECQKILKLHKLKVSVLDQEQCHEDQNGHRKKESTSNAEPSRKKSSLRRLTVHPLETFQELDPRFHVYRRLVGNLVENGYTVPTEVQLAALPLLLGTDEDRGIDDFERKKEAGQSHVDLLTIAPTGSGKTLAYLIPVIQGILAFRRESRMEAEESLNKDFVKAIILAPTHELADQIVNETRRLVVGTAVRVTAMRKGMHLEQANDASASLERETIVKSDIIVSTPLTLLNFLSPSPESGLRELPNVHYLVLDEADVLLDPLFRDQTLGVWNACTSPLLQTSLWSATIASSIESLAQKTITARRKRLFLSTNRNSNHRIIRLIAGIKDTALSTIFHRLIYAATEQGKLLALRQILRPTPDQDTSFIPSLLAPFLVFTQTILRATALYSELKYDIPVEAGGSARIAVLHSSLSDSARADIMARFRKGEIWVLITTDLLARGIDFRGINGVVNYDIPTTSAAYVHRAGRTGRAGREGGMAITLYTRDDVPYVKNVANVIKGSEKARASAVGGKKEGGNSEAVPKWLLDALPDVSKKTRKRLKTRGVESRRAEGGKEGRKGAAATKISTKSGFERKAKNRKVGAVEGSRKRTQRREGKEDQERREERAEDEWGGFED